MPNATISAKSEKDANLFAFDSVGLKAFYLLSRKTSNGISIKVAIIRVDSHKNYLTISFCLVDAALLDK